MGKDCEVQCVFGGVEYVLTCVLSTCGGVHVCECEPTHATACMEIREQPWVLVLIFHFFWDKVPCSLQHIQAGWPTTQLHTSNGLLYVRWHKFHFWKRTGAKKQKSTNSETQWEFHGHVLADFHSVLRFRASRKHPGNWSSGKECLVSVESLHSKHGALSSS